MGRTKSQSLGKRVAKAIKGSQGQEAQDTAKEPEKVSLEDGAAIKRALDEEVVEVLKEQGYRESHFVANVKIACSAVTCLLAALAQFGIGKVPEAWVPLALCVGASFLLSYGQALFQRLQEGESFVRTTGGTGKGAKPVLEAASHLPKHGLEYTLSLYNFAAPRGAAPLSAWDRLKTACCLGDARTAGVGKAVRSRSVETYFGEDGFLAVEAFRRDVRTLVGQAEDLSKRS